MGLPIDCMTGQMFEVSFPIPSSGTGFLKTLINKSLKEFSHSSDIWQIEIILVILNDLKQERLSLFGV